MTPVILTGVIISILLLASVALLIGRRFAIQRSLGRENEDFLKEVIDSARDGIIKDSGEMLLSRLGDIPDLSKIEAGQCETGHAAVADSGLFASGAENDKPAPVHRGLRILGAEDNHINQTILRTLIEIAGHRIDIVNDGAEAVAAIMRTPYDVILMDDHLPNMDGVTATQKIRDLPGETGRIPIIAITANAMKGDREKYLATGMSDYVSKPIDRDSLFAAIGRCTGCDAPPAIQASTVGPASDITGDAASDLENLLSGLDDLSATGT